jgi:hypothetical protein
LVEDAPGLRITTVHRGLDRLFTLAHDALPSWVPTRLAKLYRRKGALFPYRGGILMMNSTGSCSLFPAGTRAS